MTPTGAALHQFVPTFEPGAVGAHILELQQLAAEVTGRPSLIFTEHIHPAMAGRAFDYREYGTKLPASPADLLVYQFAIGSVVGEWLCGHRQRLVVDHHNLTPVRYLQGWDPQAQVGLLWGDRQLRELSGRAEAAIAHSEFNQSDLRAAGFSRTPVLPVLVDLEGELGASDPATDDRLAAVKRSGGADWLFVGRIVANKCQHHIIRAFAVYRRLYDPAARLWLVGGAALPTYADALRRYIAQLDLQGAVHFTGSVSQAALVSHYRSADAFVCLSEHEGFCVPLVEAMWHGLPVIAGASSAVPQTVGDAGIVLPMPAGRQPPAAQVAAAVNRVLTDAGLRETLAAAGRRRANSFSLAATRPAYRTLLGELLSSGGGG